MRGANQSLVFSSAAGSASSAVGSTMPVGSAELGNCTSAVVDPSADSVSATGVRTTTGGMGREPGMLIRIRVVSVVSVLRSSGCAAERPASVRSSEAAGVPYGGVPEG